MIFSVILVKLLSSCSRRVKQHFVSLTFISRYSTACDVIPMIIWIFFNTICILLRMKSIIQNLHFLPFYCIFIEELLAGSQALLFFHVAFIEPDFMVPHFLDQRMPFFYKAISLFEQMSASILFVVPIFSTIHFV